MAWTLSIPGTTKIRLLGTILTGNNTAVQAVLSATNLDAEASYIPSTHPIWFYADTAPTGWTLVGAVTDALLAVKGGSSAYNVTGGQVVGTWDGPAYQLLLTDLPGQTTVNAAGGGSTLYRLLNPANPLGNAHQHDWNETRPSAALGVLAYKIT